MIATTTITTTTRILIVEDELLVGELMRATLERNGFRAEGPAGTAGEARELLAIHDFDLVLMDIRLGDHTDGVELASEIREQRDLPIVFLTAYSDSDTVRRARTTEPAGFLIKPLDMSELLVTIETSLDRHLRERQLRARERWLETTLDGIGDGTIAVDPAGCVTFLNRAAEQITGWSETESCGRPLQEVLRVRTPAGEVEVAALLRSAIEHNRLERLPPRSTLTVRDARPVAVDGSIAPVPGGEGVSRGAVVVLQDASDRRRVEVSMHPNEERFCSVFEHAPCGLALVDGEGIVQDGNAAFAELLGIHAAEVAGTRLAELVDAGAFTAMVDVARGAAAGPFRGPVRWRRAAGATVDLDLSVCALSAAGGQPEALVIAQDMTEQKLLEERLRQAEKLEAMGRFAGGVAQDFNNLLTAIIGQAEYAMSRPLEAAAAAREILACGSRAEALVHKLLAFGRRQPGAARSIDANAALRAALPSLLEVLGDGVRVDLELDPELGAVAIDPSFLDQVVINLTANAAEAMPGGGCFTVRSGLVEVSPDSELDGPLLPGRYAAFAFRDTGRGVPAAVLRKVFDPFFTTKAAGRGSGLGLSTVHGIVRQSRGHVTLASREGHGATVTVYLPLAESSAGGDGLDRGDEESGAAVLVVDDDPQVCSLIELLLGHHGHKVTATTDPREGVALVERPGDGLDVVVTDFVMPHMNGVELYRQVRRSRPALPVVFMSGYAPSEELQVVLDRDAGTGFLTKPFGSAGLLAAITRAIRASADGR